ncbi:TonB-dependent receptor [Mucilaginibacter boryungensis]|uniref:TonB-dependent receptor plug domain-containing protein n=1 Tax=Mucilaginibacter boryungensis TaxID=768480 RepID=A0ABR9XBS3_9SPHI|nr:TonB-dependent receptor [Mucilaginibacter boryungensis]MBE9664802.1 TonB-dependent receptor plug domain-containing protein [Mucilaginibacter boryungensis]
MKFLFSLMAIVLACFSALAQNTFKAKVVNYQTKVGLKGATATIPDLKITAVADTSGQITITNIPNGKFQVEITYIGFIKSEQVYNFPLQHPEQVFEIGLIPSTGELAGVTIQTTRTNQNLQDIPTRMEALPLEELDEKTTMRPGDIKMLLGETTGIHVQQTSAVSGSASFRIQGLDSRYTQLLQDGMPLYAGFSGSLSLLQISPLNLRQVEFIKGSASTLYGGGAIAGLVNLISKVPETDPELTVLLNGSSAKGADASAYYSQKWQHIGTTLFGSYNYNKAFDPSAVGFTAIPKTNRFTINPKVFLYMDDRNSGWFGVNTTYEDRLGGDLQVAEGKADNTHQYFERNKTFRFSTQLSFTHKIDGESRIGFKNTVGYFDRQLGEPGFDFKGRQFSSFSEINYVHNGEKASWVAGANLVTDHFAAKPPKDMLSYNQATTGIFLQNTYKATDWFSIESGLRLDKNTPAPDAPSSGLFFLPRVNALFKITDHLTSRIGGGLGYKMPTLFNDESEQDGYEHIQPLNIGNTRAEQSYGLNGDLNYRSKLGDEAFININQLFFSTRVNRPLILQNNAFINAPGYLNTQGTETNIKLVLDELVFYLGYTFTDTKQHFSNLIGAQPLTPKHQLSFDATYEIEGSFRFGVESFYTGPQLLSDGTTGKGYITFGMLVQKMWKHLDLFVNAENLTDQRQTKWGSIYTGTITKPKFRDIYTPLDGVVVNAGVRIKLLTNKL